MQSIKIIYSILISLIIFNFTFAENSQITPNQTQINPYNLTFQNSERTRINNLISVKNTELTNEQAFIDREESKMQAAVFNDGVNDAKSPTATIISLIPIVGEGYDIITLLAGKDPITKEALTPVGVAFTTIGLASGLASGKAARDFANEALARLATEMGADLPTVLKHAEEVARQEYTLKSISDVNTLYNSGKLKLSVFVGKVKAKVATVFKVVNNVKYVNTPAQAGLKGTIDVKNALSQYIGSDAKIVVSDTKLQNYMTNLYRGKPAGQMVGDGGAADAMRYTKQTGIKVGGGTGDHIEKVTQTLVDLKSWLSQTTSISARDKVIADLIINDLSNAVKNL